MIALPKFMTLIYIDFKIIVTLELNRIHLKGAFCYLQIFCHKVTPYNTIRSLFKKSNTKEDTKCLKLTWRFDNHFSCRGKNNIT
jgi:hypothetical protein